MLKARSSTSCRQTGWEVSREEEQDSGSWEEEQESRRRSWEEVLGGGAERRCSTGLVLFAFVLLHVGTVFARQQAFDLSHWNWGVKPVNHSTSMFMFMFMFMFTFVTQLRDSRFSCSVSMGGLSMSSSTSP